MSSARFMGKKTQVAFVEPFGADRMTERRDRKLQGKLDTGFVLHCLSTV